MTIYKNISVPVRCTDEIAELYNVRDMLRELKKTTEEYNKPDTIIHNYKPPDDCVTCPFFKVNVANAGDDASLECRILKQKFRIKELPYLRDRRYEDCPMEELEDL